MLIMPAVHVNKRDSIEWRTSSLVVAEAVTERWSFTFVHL